MKDPDTGMKTKFVLANVFVSGHRPLSYILMQDNISTDILKPPVKHTTHLSNTVIH